ncbi:hypothetical protein EF405_03770 [Cyclobacteriaceae bacterium YHN15]|nr:hypothetical protein EF405_03770 [Cyclobacteriaceae bacterium YHN15]
MKSLFSLIWICLIASSAIAQKNVVPTTSIQALNLKLPQGSKQDKRFLSIAAATSFMEAEVSDPNVKLSETEVYILPSKAESAFVTDSLVLLLEASGFQINPLENDHFAWVSKEGVSYFTFLSVEEKATNLYLAKSNRPPDSRPKLNPSQKTISSNITIVFPDYIPPLPPGRNTISNPLINQKPPIL